MLAWHYLAGAILFEITGTMALKYSSINESPLFTIITVIGYFISFAFLYFAIKKIDIGIAYAIWAGLGTAIIAIGGVFIFKEEMNLLKAACILLIIVGSVGLKYLSGANS